MNRSTWPLLGALLACTATLASIPNLAHAQSLTIGSFRPTEEEVCRGTFGPNFVSVGHPVGFEPPFVACCHAAVPMCGPSRILGICPKGFVVTATDPGFPDSAAECTLPPGRVASFKDEAGQPNPCCGDPIHPPSGNLYEEEVDYLGAGPFPLRMIRRYNSNQVDIRTSQDSQFNLGMFPAVLTTARWRGEYDRRVILNEDGVALKSAFLKRHDGRIEIFTLIGATWTPDPDVTGKLERLVDGSGAPRGWRYTSADGDLTETYDASGRLVSLANRAGLAHTLTYSTGATPRRDILTHVTDSFGRELKFTYDAQGRLRMMIVPGGGEYRYEYDANGMIQRVTYPDLAIRVHHYEDTNLTGITDENGNQFVTWTYANSRAVSSQRAGGSNKVEIISFAPTNQVREYVTDSLFSTRTYGYAITLGVRRNTSISAPACPSCGPASQSFDGNGFVASQTDWNASVTTHERADATRPDLETSRTEASGTAEARTINTAWHPTFRVPTEIHEVTGGRRTTLTYDDRGNLTSRTVTDTASGRPRTWTYTYSYSALVPGMTERLVVDGPRTDAADTTTYDYYAADAACTGASESGCRGQLRQITNPLSHATQITLYNAHGQPEEIVDPNGLVTTLTYDARQRLTSRSFGGELTSYEYDGVGQLTKVTLPDGSSLAYTYDAAHRLTGLQDNLGNRIAYTLDLMGNRTREDVFDPASQLAQTRSRVYSSLNRLEQEIGGTNPAAQITSYGYDNQGNLTSITDPLNRPTANLYDALNRLKQVTDPANGSTGYGYDGLDRLTRVTDPRNNATGYTLDGLGNLSAQSSPDTGSTSNTHDEAGNLISSTDAKGQSTSYGYDPLNRLIRIVYNQAIGSQLKQIDYGYDQGTNGIGRLTSITETSAAGGALSTMQYGYDQKGRLNSETRTFGGTSFTTGYTYDAAGRITGMTYPSGRTLAYGL
ncbi:MAG: DUF6531 domain-containing protein, partial [Burkholderiales bacterium]